MTKNVYAKVLKAAESFGKSRPALSSDVIFRPQRRFINMTSYTCIREYKFAKKK